jgi:hypothetical protein
MRKVLKTRTQFRNDHAAATTLRLNPARPHLEK